MALTALTDRANFDLNLDGRTDMAESDAFDQLNSNGDAILDARDRAPEAALALVDKVMDAGRAYAQRHNEALAGSVFSFKRMVARFLAPDAVRAKAAFAIAAGVTLPDAGASPRRQQLHCTSLHNLAQTLDSMRRGDEARTTRDCSAAVGCPVEPKDR